MKMGKFRIWLVKIIANGDFVMMNANVNGKYVDDDAVAVYCGKVPEGMKAVISPVKGN
jgi:hypothetical protein